jgi:Uma2 family endonuclease
MASLPQQFVSPDEYLASERRAAVKSEYIDGVVYAMAGASERHNVIVANLIISIGVRLRGRPCRVYPSDLKVGIPNRTRFFYPDVSVVCGEPVFADEHKDVVQDPMVIIEVLSEKTSGFDRGRKFLSYLQMDSLREYFLVEQDEVQVEKYERRDDGKWLYMKVSGIDSSVVLDSIDCKIPLTEIYERVF